MPDEKDKRDIWFQYVVKLNDRNLSRKRAYGITFWGTLGFFGIMLYRILDKIPLIIKSSNNYYILTLSIATLLNLTEVFICLLIGLIVLMNTTYTLRLQSKLSRFSYPIYGILATILHLLVFILNFRIFFIFNKISIPVWPYIIMFIYAGAELFVRIRKRVILFRKFRFEMFKLPYLSVKSWLPSQEKRVIGSIFVIIIGLILSISPIFGIIHIFRYTPILENIYILKTSIEITLCLYIIFLLIIMLVKFLHESYLIDLERRIVVENLSSKSIQESFVQELLGPDSRARRG